MIRDLLGFAALCVPFVAVIVAVTAALVRVWDWRERRCSETRRDEP